MIADITNHREELRQLCRRFHVQRLDVFGSAARGDFEAAQSDLDFLVDFEPMPPAAYADAYFGLKEALEQLFGRPVDLIDRKAIAASCNYIRKEHILTGAEPIYAA